LNRSWPLSIVKKYTISPDICAVGGLTDEVGVIFRLKKIHIKFECFEKKSIKFNSHKKNIYEIIIKVIFLNYSWGLPIVTNFIISPDICAVAGPTDEVGVIFWLKKIHIKFECFEKN